MRDLQSRAGSTLKVAAFYHCWASGAWEEPLAEFLEALDRSGFDGPLFLGIVGILKERRAVQTAVTRSHKVAIATEEGYEQVTLKAVHSYALRHNGAVLYGHTKGAYRNYQIQRSWRHEVTEQVVYGWRENVIALEDHDVVGSSWQTDWEPEPTGFLANFWLGRCDYLRTLPAPSGKRRTAAETWIGTNHPRVYDLAPRRMRWIPTDGRDVDGGRSIKVPEGSVAIMITEGQQVIAVQIVPAEWLPEVTERMVWRVLSEEEVLAWKASYV